ncbi:MAG: FAD:protein FMN transferase [Alphaproteobacteria bacterium]
MSETPIPVRPSGAITRRRAIRILGAAAGAPLLLPLASAIGANAPPRAVPGGPVPVGRGFLFADGPFYRWQGTVMGTEAEIVLALGDEATARAVIAAADAEAERLERIFSLFREDSEIVRLNAHGHLERPSAEMVQLLAESRRFGALSGGAFDVTVQPLWSLYRRHFAAHPHDASGPAAREIALALRRVDYRAIRLIPSRVWFGTEGTEVTLNGIAQGFITDRVADLLRGYGIRNVLVEMGETRALGARPDGGPWRIGVPDPGNRARLARTVPLANRAVATSAPYGTVFEPTGRFHHLLDPRRGTCASRYRSVTVMADRATIADALSTALSAMALEDVDRLIRRVPGAAAFLIPAVGAPVTLGA